MVMTGVRLRVLEDVRDRRPLRCLGDMAEAERLILDGLVTWDVATRVLTDAGRAALLRPRS